MPKEVVVLALILELYWDTKNGFARGLWYSIEGREGTKLVSVKFPASVRITDAE